MSKVYFVIDNTLAHIYKFKHTDFNYLPNHVLCIREYTEDKRKIPSLNDKLGIFLLIYKRTNVLRNRKELIEFVCVNNMSYKETTEFTVSCCCFIKAHFVYNFFEL